MDVTNITDMLKAQVLRFQRIHVGWLTRYRNFNFDVTYHSHVSLLQRLWKAVFKDMPFPGAESDHYKKMGFQVI